MSVPAAPFTSTLPSGDITGGGGGGGGGGAASTLTVTAPVAVLLPATGHANVYVRDPAADGVNDTPVGLAGGCWPLHDPLAVHLVAAATPVLAHVILKGCPTVAGFGIALKTTLAFGLVGTCTTSSFSNGGRGITVPAGRVTVSAKAANGNAVSSAPAATVVRYCIMSRLQKNGIRM